MSRDLLHQDDVRELVREAYRSVDTESRAVAEKLYSPEELEGVPAIALDHALGVGNHLLYARIEPGDTVLDSGADPASTRSSRRAGRAPRDV